MTARGTLSESAKKRLSKSRAETQYMTARDLRCPNCSFLITRVYSDVRGHMQIYCPKCKNKYIMNFAYFRPNRHTRKRDFKITLMKIE